MENVKDTLRNYILEHFQIEADDPDFGDDVHLFDYGFVDSLGATEIVLFLERLPHPDHPEGYHPLSHEHHRRNHRGGGEQAQGLRKRANRV